MNTQQQAQSVDEFCQAHGISRSSFYNMLKDGNAPAVIRVGRRVLISAEAATAWRQRMTETTSNSKAAA